MKQLQNNFTTPEQSKRLLELGVPADSADCYLTRFGIDEDWEIKALNRIQYSEIAINNQDYYIPCWSVGRLIEILSICCKLKPAANIFMLAFWGETIDGLIEEITDYTIYYDFSKLKE